MSIIPGLQSSPLVPVTPRRRGNPTGWGVQARRQELDALLLSSGFPGACCHLHPFPDGPGTQAKLGHGGGGGRGGSSMDWSILKISFNPKSSEHNLGLGQRCCLVQEPAGEKAGHS